VIPPSFGIGARTEPEAVPGSYVSAIFGFYPGFSPILDTPVDNRYILIS